MTNDELFEWVLSLQARLSAAELLSTISLGAALATLNESGVKGLYENIVRMIDQSVGQGVPAHLRPHLVANKEKIIAAIDETFAPAGEVARSFRR